VNWADRVLRKNPQRVTFYAPIVTYLMTLMAGTGHTAFSTLPVIAEVAKEGGVRPSRPLAISVVSSQIAITASPVSAAVIYLSGELEANSGVGYIQLLAISIPTSFIGVMVGAFVANLLGKPLDQDPEYKKRLADGRLTMRGARNAEIKPGAKLSVGLFLCGVVLVMAYATAISDNVGLIKDPPVDRNAAIISIMLTVATIILLVNKIPPAAVTTATTFRAGMSACVCVLGVAWLGSVFVKGHMEDIQDLAGDVLTHSPWLLAVVVFLAAALLYSQAATAKAIMPIAFALGMSPVSIVASFAAVSALFILPTYPTLIAAVEMDDTGSTRIGKYVFNHPFFIPGTVTIATSVALAFALGSVVI
jgi:anaerobic C4-dicarboxylate transporter DcuA